MNKLPKLELVIFDVDDVLISMDRACRAGEAGVGEALEPYVGAEKARAVADGVTNGYHTLIEHLRSASPEAARDRYPLLRKRIEAWQRGVVEAGHEVKQWSRDTLVAIALEDAGLEVEPELLAAGVDRYWQVLGDAADVFEDAITIVAELRGSSVAFHLATNSDGFLTFDPKRRTFVYEPVRSAERKVARLHRLLETLNLEAGDVTVGDPIGKPSPAYFEKVLEDVGAKLGHAVSRERALAIGDSLGADVLPPLSIGVGHGVLLDRAGRIGSLPEHPQVHVVRDLLALRRWL
jgi:FMN phosphatase YigB (HAD superfamily)